MSYLNDKCIYKTSREKIDNIIKKYCDEVNQELQIIVKLRIKALLPVIEEWAFFYKDKIKFFEEFVDFSNLQKNLSNAYTHYYQYVLSYRTFYQLKENMLFNKIMSFEIHFFTKYNIFNQNTPECFVKNKIYTNCDQLFYSNPFGHFLFFRILKEYKCTPRDYTGIDKEKLLEQLIETTLIKCKDFFSGFKINESIPIESFRTFIDDKNNANFKLIISRIESRLFDEF